jgi:hypothetical protein
MRIGGSVIAGQIISVESILPIFLRSVFVGVHLWFHPAVLFHPCLSVCIRGPNLICNAPKRVLYMIAACGRTKWNPRDAISESLASAARSTLHGYHGPHTKITTRASGAKTRGTFLRK